MDHHGSAAPVLPRSLDPQDPGRRRDRHGRRAHRRLPPPWLGEGGREQDLPQDHSHGRPSLLRRVDDLHPPLLHDCGEGSGNRHPRESEVHQDRGRRGVQDQLPPHVARGRRYRPRKPDRVPLGHEGEGVLPRPERQALRSQDDHQLPAYRRCQERPDRAVRQGHPPHRGPLREGHVGHHRPDGRELNHRLQDERRELHLARAVRQHRNDRSRHEGLRCRLRHPP